MICSKGYNNGVKTLCFATTNKQKIQLAKTVCNEAGIILKTVSLDIDEIQGEDPEIIIRDKLTRAYQKLGKPVVVSDDSWDIRALKGFPGPYMKSINYWFEPEDFIRLMYGIKDRHITLHQYLAYTDGKITKVFSKDIEGEIINEPRGESEKYPDMTVIALDSDNGKTIAQVFDQGVGAVEDRYKNRPDAWHELVEWYKQVASA